MLDNGDSMRARCLFCHAPNLDPFGCLWLVSGSPMSCLKPLFLTLSPVGRGKVARTRDHTGQLLAQALAEPPGAGDKRVEIYPGADAEPPHQVDEVCGRDVPGGLWCERAAARASHRRVE